MLVRFAEPADWPFIVQMACLATTLEDSPLPAADDPAVLELLPQSSDVALVASDDQGQASGAAWWRAAHAAELASVQAKLSADEFGAAWAEGHAMSREQAVDYALKLTQASRRLRRWINNPVVCAATPSS